jgi:CHAD domain-containing protein
MAKAKWFPKLTGTTPLAVAATLVLRSRVGTVREYIARVQRRPGHDPEDVHQLRVAARRLGAALSAFKSVLDLRARRKLRRAARRLRRAAGAVRDIDVLDALLAEYLHAASRPPLPLGERVAVRGKSLSDCSRRIHRLLKQRRRECWLELKRTLRVWSVRFDLAATELSADLQEQSTLDSRAHAPSLRPVAASVLHDRLNRLRTAGAADLRDLDNLHQVRIAAKRLRYAMESLAACYPAEFRRRLYTLVENIQSELGQVNDLRNLRQLMADVHASSADASPTGIDTALARIETAVDRALAQCQRGFLRWWSGRVRRNFFRRFRSLLHDRGASAGVRKRLIRSG